LFLLPAHRKALVFCELKGFCQDFLTKIGKTPNP
jgi:hypothetical protein